MRKAFESLWAAGLVLMGASLVCLLVTILLEAVGLIQIQGPPTHFFLGAASGAIPMLIGMIGCVILDGFIESREG